MIYNLAGESGPEIRDKQDTAKLDGTKKSKRIPERRHKYGQAMLEDFQIGSCRKVGSAYGETSGMCESDPGSKKAT